MHKCKECGYEAVKWVGQCPTCKSWNSLEEIETDSSKKASGVIKTLKLVEKSNSNISDKKIKTFSIELNNLLSGGIREGSLTLLSGEPGIGKSTLALSLGAWIKDKKVIYVSSEETVSQVSDRARRLGVGSNEFYLLSEVNLENIISTLKENPADIVVVDSISMIHSSEINGGSGSISQIKYVAEVFMNYTKETETAVVMIGHVTKDGNLAGPKALEHLVDTVLYFEGDKYDDLRILRSLKNRFGSTGEIAVYKMGEDGLSDIKNIGEEFVSSQEGQIGAALSVTMEGSRPILIEIESLTSYTKFGYPKRTSRGVQTSKLDIILAVLSKYTKVKLDSYDVYSNISKGLYIGEPGIDLAIAASIVSSKNNLKLDRDSIFIGEISLTGAIKSTFNLEKRLKEADKLGIKKAYIPDVDISGKYSLELIKLKSIGNLVEKI